MTEKLQQTIKEEVGKLPHDIQEAIKTFDWTKISEDIGKKYLLSEAEINNLQLETLLVLVGLTDPDFYATNIENQVETTTDEAKKMADEVMEKIFTPIGETIEENIKNNLKNKKPNPEQTLNFILSGGDYSAFLSPSPRPNATGGQALQGEGRGEVNSPLEEYPTGGGGQILPPRSDLGRSTPQVGNKTPPTLQEIKDKLLIKDK